MTVKILLVAMPDSIHVARWVNQVLDQNWKIYLFPSVVEIDKHIQLQGVTIIRPLNWVYNILEKLGLKFVVKVITKITNRLDAEFPTLRSLRLATVIGRLNPDIVHSIEIQAAGYLTLAARKKFQGKFPKWIVTNWGSDIYLFGRLQSHKSKIHEVLSQCDYYSCECLRDVHLAQLSGCKAQVLSVFPNTGGFDLSALAQLRQSRTSERRLIMLKGYQTWAGRALVALRALERCSELLEDYEICIYSASPDVIIAAELFSEATGISSKIVPHNTPHEEILALHAQARISIGLSISDAISTSLLEALVMGSFPIQSCTSCAEEWITHGESGWIVPPEDPDVVEIALRAALNNDELVNRASKINWQTALGRLEGSVLKKKTIDMYSGVLKNQ